MYLFIKGLSPRKDVRYCTLERKERRSKSRNFAMQNHFPRKGTADFVGYAHRPLFALAQSEDVGKLENSGKVRVAINIIVII